MSTPIPAARDDDPEDVSWALSTAATSFSRGDRVEALKWLRRAAEAASEADRDVRALELAKAAAELSTLPAPSVRPAPMSRPPAAPPSRPVSVAPSRPPAPAPSRPPPPVPSRPSSAPSRPAPAPSRPAPAPRPAEARKVAARANKSASASKSKADETGRRAAMRKSASSEVERTPTPAAAAEDTHPHEAAAARSADESAGSDTSVTAVRPPLKTPPATVTAHEADSWPTETSDPTAEGQVYGQERTRIGMPAFQEKRAPAAAQAVRVILWRGPDGALRVAPQGTPVSAVAMEALLVALDPDADLLAWLAPL